jgi:hypothetical protein
MCRYFSVDDAREKADEYRFRMDAAVLTQHDGVWWDCYCLAYAALLIATYNMAVGSCDLE